MANKNLMLLLSVTCLLSLALVGCGGDNDSSPVAPPAPPADTQPPILPTGLEADYDDVSHQVSLSWRPNTVDADFAGFLITRWNYDHEVELVTEPQAANSFVDSVEGLGRSVTYEVYSVDEAGNVSAAASVSLEIEVREVGGPRPVDL